MRQTSKTLPSGAVLVIQSAPWAEAHRLYKAVMGVIAKTTFSKEDLVSFFAKLSIDESIETALWPCFGRATYNNVKITSDLFETNDAAQADFLILQKEVLAFNLAPFLGSLSSLLSGVGNLSDIFSQGSGSTKTKQSSLPSDLAKPDTEQSTTS